MNDERENDMSSIHHSSFIIHHFLSLLFVAARATFPIKSRSLFLTQKGAHERG
jgi:hypothetical protein